MPGGSQQFGYREIGVTGIDELLKSLDVLASKLQSRVMRSALNATATPMKRMLRGLVNVTPIRGLQHPQDKENEGSLRAGVRKTVGHKVQKDVAKGYVLTVGFGVGKKGAKRSKQTSRGVTKGVGVSARNVHWFVTGTPRRSRSQIHGFFGGVMAEAFSASQPMAIEAFRAKAAQRIPIEAERARRKGG